MIEQIENKRHECVYIVYPNVFIRRGSTTESVSVNQF